MKNDQYKKGTEAVLPNKSQQMTTVAQIANSFIQIEGRNLSQYTDFCVWCCVAVKQS